MTTSQARYACSHGQRQEAVLLLHCCCFTTPFKHAAGSTANPSPQGRLRGELYLLRSSVNMRAKPLLSSVIIATLLQIVTNCYKPDAEVSVMYASEAGYLLTSNCIFLSSHLQESSYKVSPIILAHLIDLPFQQKILSLLTGSLIAEKDLLPEFCRFHILTASQTRSQHFSSLPLGSGPWVKPSHLAHTAEGRSHKHSRTTVELLCPSYASTRPAKLSVVRQRVATAQTTLARPQHQSHGAS